MRHFLLGIAIVLFAAHASLPGQDKAGNAGILPVGADGRSLNLDFETGTLKDWVAEGDAFKRQPIKGDTVFPRRTDMKSQHQGQFWIGGYENFGDRPQGTITSASFKITHPWASFLIGGGPWPETCVQLVRKDTGSVFFQASGLEEENLRRVVVDLHPYMGKEMCIRVVDRHSGHWGHVNFDDFRFHARKPDFPPRPVQKTAAPPDIYKFAGLPPRKAAEVMTAPDGFQVKLFAGEPDVHQPIAMCLDDRGRLWVVEAFCYPRRKPSRGPFVPKDQHGDRILIFEDTDGDGAFDKKTLFIEGLNLVSGIEVGFGGVWVGAAPYLLFIPIKEGTDEPAGEPKILLDGFGWHDTHETLNAFIWGPDGWLYGCHGVFTHSRVGKPGTPDPQRTPINAGIWRYHPTRHIFEVFAHGTSNPWGLDFNDHGQAFIEACVIPHCFHIIQGARYLRQAGSHFNPYTYADIQTIADHLHWMGADPWAGNNRSDSAGGGHAHCGLMVYLGGSWPKKYRDQLFMGNIHGRRINMDQPRVKGSGYVAGHGPDFLLANDAWARFINQRYGPDGNVYLVDWYDKQACHLPNPEVWDRTNGRIYKICYRGAKPVRVDLAKLSDNELIQLQLHENDWYVRHARRLLQERLTSARATGDQKGQVHQALARIALEHPSETRRLRGLWTLHVTGGLADELLLKAMQDANAYVRGWAIQLALERGTPSTQILEMMNKMAREDAAPVVRLYLASGVQRLPESQRWDILRGLLAHAEDAADQNLPFMYWYAAEPLGAKNSARALDLAYEARVPPVLEFMVRRIASAATPEAISLLVNKLAGTDEPTVQLTFLRGIREALKGTRQLKMPAAWPDTFARLRKSPRPEIRAQAVAVAVTFGDPRALGEMRAILASPKADLGQRLNALGALQNAKDKLLAPILQALLEEPAMRGPALSALAAYDDPRSPGLILKVYALLNSTEKRNALNTLASRPSYGKALLQAIADRRIAANDVPAEIIRQLRNLHNAELDQRIAQVWGIVRDTPADRARMIAQYRGQLRGPGLPPDLAHGRAMFVKVCAQCHTLFGAGGKIGPDLTGSNRANLDYLLENILDPSAVIPKEYAATLLELGDGRVITGIVRGETPQALTVVTANETLTLPRKEIEAMKPGNVSMMPDDLLKPLSPNDVRCLVAYLQSPNQVPLLATAENAKDFFNGKDLAGWDGDSRLWKVENAEIVGRSPGLKRNEFLRSHMTASDFKLSLKVKLVPDSGNSGVQFRSQALPDGEMKGPQADIGEGWWGKLYEENGRGLLWKKSGESFVKKNDWNTYEIVARGSKIRTYINGHLSVDIDDPRGMRRGIFALQIHSGPAMEVRFKDLRLEVLP
jgi:putative membrane-bound dehydrogenase-like protein